MFHRAYIEQIGNGKLRHEEELVLEDCKRRGVEPTLYHAKQIQRRQLPLANDCFICGDMDAMHGAMKQLGIEPPVPNDFPESLAPFFHRRVWRSTFDQLETALDNGREIFAKPAGRRKLFTGRVFFSPEDMHGLSHISRQEPLWCSDVVEWRSEYRVYVIEGSIVSIDHYAGDVSIPLEEPTVCEALSTHAASGTAPAAYGIDFGVLSTGETALVEANDGYALGAYQIDSAAYARLLYTRWSQLLLKTTHLPQP